MRKGEEWIVRNLFKRQNYLWSRDDIQEEEEVTSLGDSVVGDLVSLNKEPIKGDRRVTGTGLDSR